LINDLNRLTHTENISEHPMTAMIPLVIALALMLPSTDVDTGDGVGVRVIENFQQNRPGEVPRGWKLLRNRRIIPLLREHYDDQRHFYVREEGGRRFVRGYTQGKAMHIILPANDGEGGGFGWDLNDHPILSWDWRALELPEGAREDRVNDTGAAVYVTFGTDWLGRPRSIKYTYSSGLPKGTIVRFGPLRVLVVDTALEGIGRWQTVTRDVVADYRAIFGGDPPNEPLSITLWSDSDDTNSTGKADFDNIRVSAGR
jgi:hypothetical protein